MTTPDEVLEFWLDEVGPSGWYGGGEELDATCRERFLTAWTRASKGALSLWLTYPTGVLAYIVLTDQLPRNMFRGAAAAFSTDAAALAAAKAAIAREWDMKIDPPARQFFYLPLMHSENLTDQERSVRLFHERMPDAEDNLLHARAHRMIIRKFGRFPYRNDALSRPTAVAEAEFMENGGYGAVVRELSAEA